MLPETPKSWGKAAPETFFGKLIDTFSPNFPNSGGMLAEILAAARQAFSFATDSDQEWIFAKTTLTLYPALAEK